MTVLKFDSFELPVNEYLHDGIFIGCDLKIEQGTLFDKLLPFLNQYSKDRYPLQISINDDSFEGYLGNYTFDKKGNVRIWLAKEYIEDNNKKTLSELAVHRYGVQYQNVLKYVKQHEIKLNNLVELLKTKDVLTDLESKDLLSEFHFMDNDIDFNHEVTDLPSFLKDINDRLEDIKSEIST